MPSDLDIEILTIDDSAPAVKTVLNKTKNPLRKKWRTVRKSTGVGGKAPHSAIPFKPLRKSLPVKPTTPRKTRNVNPEYFEVDDDDSDDEIQVIENDPLDDVEVLSDGAAEGFCDMCGLYLENSKDMESHHETVHKLVTCKWCQNRMATSEIKNHIGAKLCSNFTKLLGSHCSVHNEIETDEQLELESFKTCRPLRCDACFQRYDSKSLREFDERSKSFICPGCLHGRIDASEDTSAEADNLDTTVADISYGEGVSQSPNSSSKLDKISMPIPQFLSTPNPIPLPEILLLDDDQEHPVTEACIEVSIAVNGVVKHANYFPAESAEHQVEHDTETGNKSQVKKRSSTDLTSKLVEMINTELQEKVVAVVKDIQKSPVKDVVDIEILETEKSVGKEVGVCPEKENPHENDVQAKQDDVVYIETELPGKNVESLENYRNHVEITSTEIEVFEVAENEKSPEKDVEAKLVEIELPGNVVESTEKYKDVENTSSEIKVLEVAEHYIVASTNPSDSVIENDSLNVVSLESSTNKQSPRTEHVAKLANPPSPGNVTLVPATPARRVARKSTKPPQNPQRLFENSSELLLFENKTTDVKTPSPKRKLESPVTSVRKVARKSTRPPMNPQRTLFNEETVEKKLHSNYSDKVVACSNNELDSSLLLETPEKGYKNVMDELEVLDELVG